MLINSTLFIESYERYFQSAKLKPTVIILISVDKTSCIIARNLSNDLLCCMHAYMDSTVYRKFLKFYCKLQIYFLAYRYYNGAIVHSTTKLNVLPQTIVKWKLSEYIPYHN